MSNPNIVVMPPEDSEFEGRAKPGEQRNPNGLAGKQKARMLKYARGKSIKAIKHLCDIMDNEKAGFTVRKDAAIALLNRAWGAPKQEIEIADQGATLEEMLKAIWDAKRREVAGNIGESAHAPLTIEGVAEPSE